MDLNVITILSSGFVIGLTHAFEADHVAAVSTIVSEHKSVKRSSIIGTVWGLGHTASLLVVGVIVLASRVSIPERFGPYLEMPVAVMLVGLGAAALLAAARDRGIKIHTHEHSHDGEPPHRHVHVHADDAHAHRHHTLKLWRKPFVVGAVHGVAGSAVVMLAVLATLPSLALGLIYIALFGIGSVGGMLLMSAIISLPLVFTARRFTRVNTAIRVVAGLVSIGLGLLIGWELVTKIRFA